MNGNFHTVIAAFYPGEKQMEIMGSVADTMLLNPDYELLSFLVSNRRAGASRFFLQEAFASYLPGADLEPTA